MSKLLIICTDINDADYTYKVCENVTDEYIDKVKYYVNELRKLHKQFGELANFYEKYRKIFQDHITWNKGQLVLDENVFNESDFADTFSKSDFENIITFYEDEIPHGEYYLDCPAHTINYVKVFEYNSVYDL